MNKSAGGNDIYLHVRLHRNGMVLRSSDSYTDQHRAREECGGACASGDERKSACVNSKQCALSTRPSESASTDVNLSLRSAGKMSVLSKGQRLVQQVETEVLGTDLFATLNTVHVKYRGFFVERSICCGHPLREVCSSEI